MDLFLCATAPGILKLMLEVGFEPTSTPTIKQ